MKKIRRALIVALIGAGLGASPARGAGYEKAVMFSGRYAGAANAVTSWVDDSEALYFNPAGLAAAGGVNFSLNFSPTSSQFTGPLFAPNQSLDSRRSFSPVAGAFASINHGGLGLGIGAYVSGGTKAVFENVDFSSLGFPTLKPIIQSDLVVTEYSAGAGYEIRDGLRVGAAYRIVHVSAKLGTVKFNPANPGPAASPATLTEIQLTNLSDTAFDGFRAGFQYASEDSRWGIGGAFRSQVNFTAAGTSGGRIVAVPPGGSPLLLTGGTATVRNVFPLQVLAGVHYDISDSLRIAIDYDFTQYSKNSVLALGGSVTLPAAFGGAAIPLGDISQGWLDLHNIRIGAEYRTVSGWSWRAGYILTTKAVPQKFARATFSSPGLGHSILIGAGTQLRHSPVRLDAAGEYSFASGTVTNEQPLAGKYSSSALVMHLALSYSPKL